MTRPLRLALALTIALTATACVKEKKTSEYKTSELIVTYDRMVSSGSVVCGVWFAHESAPSTPVFLESDALITCNGNLMSVSGAGYAGTTTYSPGVDVAISIIRAVDGTNLTDTKTVY